jgi:hypothetical protein
MYSIVTSNFESIYIENIAGSCDVFIAKNETNRKNNKYKIQVFLLYCVPDIWNMVR